MAGAAGAVTRGRPSTGARERILAAALDVLKSEGFAGTSLAKVAARSGESKALIGYHFGSKQGLIAAAGRVLAEQITEHVLSGVSDAESIGELVAGSARGVWEIVDTDVRLARVFFDLNAVSVVDEEVQAAVGEIKRTWRSVLCRLLSSLTEGLDEAHATTAAVLVISGLEGLVLERLERGETAELAAARELWIDATAAAIESLAA